VGPNTGCPAARILPLTAERQKVLDRIRALRSTFKGGTMHNVGLQAGWLTLSPRWRGFWTTSADQAAKGADGSPAHLPLDYCPPDNRSRCYMQKVVVLMTDGVANWNDWNGGAPGDCSSCRSGYPGNVVLSPGAPPLRVGSANNTDYSGYGRAHEGRLGVPRASVTAELNNRMTRLCTAMRAAGMIIYTVTFNLTDRNTQDLFKGCASRPEYWFNSPTQADLRAAFRQIGTQLANLRLIR